ncbi:MAG TPA: hypothetical protein VJ866_02270 [Pyrinomonadaceae bacterium]|nr:hypothetical protein [Pyrinomonadaceae bacterium]
MKFNPSTPRVRVALFAVLFLVLAAGSNAFGQATTTTTNEELPISSSIANTCNGDTVLFQGTVHVVNTLTVDSSGGYHLKTHSNYQDVSGTGTPSGLTYNVRTTTNETVNDNDNPQFETTVIQTVKAVSQGSAPNLFVHVVMHVTVNANGQTTSTVTEVTAECRGNS